MPFTSPTFLFIFLPTFLALYWAVRRRKLCNGLLLAGSLLFYAWGERFAVVVLLFSVVGNYLAGIWVERGVRRGRHRLPFWVGVALNLVPLIALKYAAPLASLLNSLRAVAGARPVHPPSSPLPAGISFFTFMALSYLIAVRRGETVAERDPLRFGLYLSLFPLTMAGPICRYPELSPQIAQRRERVTAFADGARRFVAGLAKKVLIANTLAAPATAAFSLTGERLAPGLAWFGLACFTLQIYFDFSAYSDMAIGLGRMFGFRFMENFDAPYAATSVRAFWTRWHISLSTWFRDYVFLPVAYPTGRLLERVRLVRPRQDFWAYATGTVVTMLLIGLWHGAGWGFLLWGGYHGVLLVTERTRIGRWLSRVPRALQHAYLVLAVAIGWVLFKSETPAHAVTFLAALVGRSGTDPVSVARYALADTLLAFAAGVALSTRLGPELRRRLAAWLDSRPADRQGRAEMLVGVFEAAALAAVLVVSLAWLAARTHVPFIYFRF